eukprot:TRINITY_DN2725_c0_g1_i1.p1 TRINITY_DN2725_c0_g1~~TRINITY_DN2725_c0_g1_i1.p1  ORF type:complete len:291 (+),score=101.73 TRINITY_DN2725_c0_g1_i1:236-1108(+)
MPPAVCGWARSEKQENIDITIADFNQATWHMSNQGSVLRVSVSLKCWSALDKYGATEQLKKIYGPMLEASPETNYDVSIAFDLANPPDNAAQNPEPLAVKVGSLLRNAMASPFLTMFDGAAKKCQCADFMEINYRPCESMYLKKEGDRVICVFSIAFDDPDDEVIGRVFIQEFGKNVGGAPAVDIHVKDRLTHAVDPPMELSHLKGLKADGYVSFVLESRHTQAKNRDQIINMIMQFRNYLHYHIKCSKAYLHIRMRNRVNLLLQVLNRAKQEHPNAEKKTKSGRTFVRK